MIQKNICFGKIVDIRYGKALSDKHFPKCVFLIVSEYNVKSGLSGQIFEKLAYQIVIVLIPIGVLEIYGKSSIVNVFDHKISLSQSIRLQSYETCFV